MARPISEEELQLKKRARRRLVGAVVLVSVVAVVLPMVLDSEPKPVSQTVDIQIPSADSPRSQAATPSQPSSAPTAPAREPAHKSDVTPPGDTASAASAGPTESNSETKTASAVVQPDPTASAAATPKENRSEPAESRQVAAEPSKKTAKGATDASAGSGAFVVQVAALSDPVRVKQLQKQMAGAGVKPYTEVVATRGGEVTRVRAGPYATREAAEKARTQLKKAGLEATVVAR